MRTILIVLLLVLLPVPASAENSGDTYKIRLVCDAEQLEYTQEEILDKIEQMYGEQKRQEIEALLDPDTGTVKLTEIIMGRPVAGSHDRGTIALNTDKYPLWFIAMTVLHEAEHIERIPPTGPQGTHDTDPTTDPEVTPCGPCNHAEMQWAEYQLALAFYVEARWILWGEEGPGDPCDILCGMYYRIGDLLGECDANGCDTIPSIPTPLPPGCDCTNC